MVRNLGRNFDSSPKTVPENYSLIEHTRTKDGIGQWPAALEIGREASQGNFPFVRLNIDSESWLCQVIKCGFLSRGASQRDWDQFGRAARFACWSRPP